VLPAVSKWAAPSSLVVRVVAWLAAVSQALLVRRRGAADFFAAVVPWALGFERAGVGARLLRCRAPLLVGLVVRCNGGLVLPRCRGHLYSGGAAA